MRRAEAVQRRLAPPSVAIDQLRIRSGAPEMEVEDKQGGNDPAAKCIRCETALLATELLHSFQVSAQPGDHFHLGHSGICFTAKNSIQQC